MATGTWLWIAAGFLAAAFAGAGYLKLATPREELAAQGMTWVEDVRPDLVRTIGLLEVLAAVALVVPPLLGVAEVLAPVAASGLVLLMAGATALHARRRELQQGLLTAALLGIAAFVAWGRFGPHPF